MDDAERAQVLNEEHLKLLRIGYLISAAMTALFSLLALLYGFVFFFIFTAAAQQSAGVNDAPPPFVGWLVGLLGFGFAALMLAAAALKYYTAQCLKRRRSRVFCMVIAGLSCLEIPYGTLLGIWTFMVLTRPSVTRLFEPRSAPAGPPA